MKFDLFLVMSAAVDQILKSKLSTDDSTTHSKKQTISRYSMYMMLYYRHIYIYVSIYQNF